MSLPVSEWLHEALTPAGIEVLPLSPIIACLAVNLTGVHKDPFDRMIIATALYNQAKLMSVDGHFKHYPELQGYLIDT